MHAATSSSRLPSALTHPLSSGPWSSLEWELLLAICAAPQESRLSARLLELIHRDLDWASLMVLAEEHGLIPPLYHAVAASTSSVAATGIQDLRLRYEANARQSLWLTRELLRILEAFEAERIPALPYKGPVLAELLYGNVLSRQFADIDILIRPDHVPAAKSALRELGYTSPLHLTPAQERAYFSSGYEYSFESAHGPHLVELQWHILPRFYAIDFQMEALFRRANPVGFSGTQVTTLSPEDTFLVLCAHAAKHVWLQLSWLVDIVELARSQSLDWEFIQQEARRLGMVRIVAVTFCLADRLFGVDLSAAFKREFPQDDEVRALTENLLSIIISSAEYGTESLGYFRLMMKLREHRQERARFLWRLAVTPGIGEWETVGLPGLLFPLYRAIRVARLAQRLLFRA